MSVKRALLFAGITLSIFFLFAISASQNKHVPFLQAEKGRLTVDCGSLTDSPCLLTGEWRVYPGLHTPSLLDSLTYSFTDDIRYMHKLAGSTYVLDLYMTNPDGYYIMMPEPNGCRLWIDGEEVTPHSNERMLDDNTFALPSQSAQEKIQIVFQVSASGGTQWNYQGLIFGTGKQLKKVQEDFLVQSIVSMGIVFMLFINAITLFLQKRSERYLLLLAAVAFFSFLSTLNTTPYIRSNWAMLTIPLSDHMRPIFTECLGVIRILLRITIVRQFFPNALPRRFNAVLYCGAALFLLLIAFLPTELEYIELLLLWLTWSFIILEGWIILYGFFHEYTGTVILLIGFEIYLSSRILLELIGIGLIPHHVFFLPLIQSLRSTLLLYLVTIASTINGKFAQKYSQADDLAANLERKVIQKTATIQASQDQILRLQQQKRELTAGIAHNLNSSLFALGGYVEILKDEFQIQPPEARQYIDRIDAKVDYVQKMAADMFLMAKLDDDQVRLSQDLFDLIDLCRQMIHDVSMQTGGKHLTFTLECDVQTAYFFGDRFYLQQAVENILTNAIRSSNENGKVGLSVTVVNGMYHLAVSDNGEGISQQELPHIFERYYTKKKVGFATTGLGLPIAQEIIHRLGGSISVESSPEVGSTFTIRLPIGQEPAI